jgi:hypothetical protein
MTDNTDDRPPLEIQQSAAKVQAWLDRRPQPQPRENAFDKFARMSRSDTPPVMPAWSDQRPDREFVRWKTSRRT